MAQIRAPIFEEKVVDFICELANVSDKKVSLEELMMEPGAEVAEEPKPKKKAPAKKLRLMNIIFGCGGRI